jgi:hypothetical protein
MHVHLKPSLLYCSRKSIISLPLCINIEKLSCKTLWIHQEWVAKVTSKARNQPTNQPNSFVSFVIGVGWGALHSQPPFHAKCFPSSHPRLFVGHTWHWDKSSHPFLMAKIKVLNWFRFRVSFVWVLVTWNGPYKVKFHKCSFGGTLNERVTTT